LIVSRSSTNPAAAAAIEAGDSDDGARRHVRHTPCASLDLECAVMRKFHILFVLFALVLAPASQSRAQTSERYRVRLTTVPMDGGMRNTVAGSGSGTATLAGNRLSVTGSFDGLKSPATSATVHSGVARGVRGNAIGNLTAANATKGSISGSINLWGWLLK
jgi:hypothetical protein